MAFLKTKEPEQQSDQHAWCASGNRFAIDALLRQFGFEIAERKNHAEPVWYKRFRDVDGKPTRLEYAHGAPNRYTQRQALACVPQLEREKAAARQRGYLESKYS